MTEVVTVREETVGAARVITVDRPAKKNALDRRTVDDPDGVRVLVGHLHQHEIGQTVLAVQGDRPSARLADREPHLVQQLLSHTGPPGNRDAHQPGRADVHRRR